MYFFLCVLVTQSRDQLFGTPWTAAHQAPLSTEFSRQQNCSLVSFLLQGIFLTQGLILGLLNCRQFFII